MFPATVSDVFVENSVLLWRPLMSEHLFSNLSVGRRGLLLLGHLPILAPLFSLVLVLFFFWTACFLSLVNGRVDWLSWIDHRDLEPIVSDTIAEVRTLVWIRVSMNAGILWTSRKDCLIWWQRLTILLQTKMVTRACWIPIGTIMVGVTVCGALWLRTNTILSLRTIFSLVEETPLWAPCLGYLTGGDPVLWLSNFATIKSLWPDDAVYIQLEVWCRVLLKARQYNQLNRVATRFGRRLRDRSSDTLTLTVMFLVCNGRTPNITRLTWSQPSSSFLLWEGKVPSESSEGHRVSTCVGEAEKWNVTSLAGPNHAIHADFENAAGGLATDGVKGRGKGKRNKGRPRNPCDLYWFRFSDHVRKWHLARGWVQSLVQSIGSSEPRRISWRHVLTGKRTATQNCCNEFFLVFAGFHPLSIPACRKRPWFGCVTAGPRTIGIVLNQSRGEDGLPTFRRHNWLGLRLSPHESSTLRSNCTFSAVFASILLTISKLSVYLYLIPWLQFLSGTLHNWRGELRSEMIWMQRRMPDCASMRSVVFW